MFSLASISNCFEQCCWPPLCGACRRPVRPTFRVSTEGHLNPQPYQPINPPHRPSPDAPVRHFMRWHSTERDPNSGALGVFLVHKPLNLNLFLVHKPLNLNLFLVHKPLNLNPKSPKMLNFSCPRPEFRLPRPGFTCFASDTVRPPSPPPRPHG